MDLREKINSKKTEICLFGEIDEVLPVVEKIYNYYEKITYLTVYGEEVRLQSLNKFGISSVLYNINDANSYGFVIVCAKYNFRVLTDLLKCANMKQYVDYVSCLVLDAYINNKKLLVCMGDEMIEQINRGLTIHNGFKKTYSSVYFPFREFWRDVRAEYIHVSRLSDVHIEFVTINSNYKIFCLPYGVLNNDCISLKIPNFNFKGLFPQIYHDVEIYNPLFFRLCDRDDVVDYETVFSSKIDLFAEYLCEEFTEYSEENISRITEKLLDKDLVSTDIIKQWYSHERDRCRELCVINKIDDKLISMIEYSIEKFNVNPNAFELSLEVIIKLIRYVFDKIGFDNENILVSEVEESLSEMCGTEYPIYPCVQKAFGLENVLADKKYKVVTFKGVKYLDITEYADYIVRYTLKAQDLLKYTESDKKLERDWENVDALLGEYYRIKKKVSSVEDWIKYNYN